MANGDVIKCSIQGIKQDCSVTTVNTWHYNDRSGGSHAFDATGTAGDFWAFMGGFLEAVMSDQWIPTVCRAAWVAGPGIGRIGEYYPTGSTGGVAFANPFPPEICIALKRWTGYAARTQRGRLFLGPTDASFMNNALAGLVDVTNTDLLALTHAMSATFTSQGVGLTPVLVSKTNVPTSAAINYTGIAPQVCHRKTRRTPGFAV